MLNEKYGDLFDDYYRNKFERLGATHCVLDSFARPKSVHSIDPAVLQAVLVSCADDWTVFKVRRNALKPLAQTGILTTAGVRQSEVRKNLKK